MRLLAVLALVAVGGTQIRLEAQDRPLTFEERVELIRGLTAEYATARVLVPRSRKPLVVDPQAGYDKIEWAIQARENGPAARPGDILQFTKITIENKRLLIEINGGFKGGRKWYEGVEIGTGSRTTPIARGAGSISPGGAVIALVFPGRVPPLKALDVKKMLDPLFDFNLRTVTEQYMDSLPPETRQAITEKKVIEGMDRDQVLLAVGKPDRKVRETVDGVELEDWIYGRPPGRILFVTFEGNGVVRVREMYAGLGGEVAPPMATPR